MSSLKREKGTVHTLLQLLCSCILWSPNRKYKCRGFQAENCLFTNASWLEEISRRQADLLTTQAAADKLQECVLKLTAENDVLKVPMVFSDLWRFCVHGVLNYVHKLQCFWTGKATFV